jgi:hypothetical protein
MKLPHIKLLIILLLSTVSFQPASSQQIELVTSKPEYNFGSTIMQKIIGHDSTGFYVLKYHHGQYFVEKLDEELNLLLNEPLKVFEGFRTYKLETIVNFYNELYVFVSKARFNDVVLCYQKIDKNNLRLSSDWIDLATIEYIRGNWPDFHFTLSRQEKKLMITSQIQLIWSKALCNELYVFGEDMELVWKKKDIINYEGSSPRDSHYIVDELGNVSVLCLRKLESIFSLLTGRRNTYTIYRYTSNGEMFKEYTVTLGEKHIRGIRIIGGNHGELICAGLYSEVFRAGVRGTFFFKIDPDNGQVYDHQLNKFDDAFLARLTELDEPTMDENEEIMSYVVTDLVLRGNDKIMLIAEQFFDQSYDTYNNIIIACYDTTGNVYWNQVVEKKQDFDFRTFYNEQIEHSGYRDYIMETGELYPTIENYCSYALMAPLDQTSIILFFNDDIRNLDPSRKRKNFNNPRKSYLQAVVVDIYGNISRQPVLKHKKKGLFPEPIRFYDTRYNCIVIPAFKGNKFDYNKITAWLTGDHITSPCKFLIPGSPWPIDDHWPVPGT